MMTLITRNDLVKILDEMDKRHADNIRIDVNIDCDYNIKYIDFDIYRGTEYFSTVLTLE